MQHITNFIEKSKKYLSLESSTTDAHGSRMVTSENDFTKDVCSGNMASIASQKDEFTL